MQARPRTSCLDAVKLDVAGGERVTAAEAEQRAQAAEADRTEG